MLPDLTDQFIADSYAGILHTSNVPVSQNNLTQVYDGLGNKTSMQIGAENGGAAFSGSVAVDGTASVDELSIAGYSTLINYLYPVGSVYFSATDTNPTFRFANTIWTQISQGRFITGVGIGTDTDGNNKTFNPLNNDGSYSKVLNSGNIPPHYHHVAANFINTLGTDSPTADDYIAVSDGVGYRLKGTTVTPTLGRTSAAIGGSTDPTEASAVSITPPSFGLYIWQRTA